MPRMFATEHSRGNRTLQVWLVLISKASIRETITFGEVADLMHFGHAQGVPYYLSGINQYCEENELPRLTCLVVNQKTERPTYAFPGVSDIKDAWEGVWKFDWFSIIPPNPQELEDAAGRFEKGII